MGRLTKRADFVRAAKGVRRSAAGLTLELCPTPATFAQPGGIRVGFTASRKIGNAVARNRARRRLKAAAAAVIPLYGLSGNDYVVVARRETLSRPFEGLLGDLRYVLHAVHIRIGRSQTGEPG